MVFGIQRSGSIAISPRPAVSPKFEGRLILAESFIHERLQTESSACYVNTNFKERDLLILFGSVNFPRGLLAFCFAFDNHQLPGSCFSSSDIHH